MFKTLHTSRKLGFIGAGNMAESLIKGLLIAGNTSPRHILASAPTLQDVANVKQLGCQTTHANIDVLKEKEVIALLVKPQIMGKVLNEISPHVTKDHLLLSFAAGSQLSAMQDLLPRGTRLARIMTSLPVQFCQGVSTYTIGEHCTENDNMAIKTLLDQVGFCTEVTENLLDTVTGFSGAGPAYAYYFIEALADGAVLGGINRKDAIQMAAKSLLGAATMVEKTNTHPAVLKDNVCSAGGCTIQGVNTLDKHATKAAVVEAIQNASKSSKELGVELNKMILNSLKVNTQRDDLNIQPLKRVGMTQ